MIKERALILSNPRSEVLKLMLINKKKEGYMKILALEKEAKYD